MVKRRRDYATVRTAELCSKKRRIRVAAFNVTSLEDDNNAVVIKVGKDIEQVTFTLRKDALVAASNYFDASLNGRFAEAQTGIVILENENPNYFNVFIRWLNGKAPVENTLTQPWDAYLLDPMIFADQYVVVTLAWFCWKQLMILFRPISFAFEQYRPSLDFLTILDQRNICELGGHLREHIIMYHVVFLVEDAEKQITTDNNSEEAAKILAIVKKWKRAAGDDLAKLRLEKTAKLRRERNALLQTLKKQSETWDRFCIDNKIRCTYPAVGSEEIKKKLFIAMPTEEKRSREWTEGDLKLAIQSDYSWLHDDPDKAEAWAAELLKFETTAVERYAKYKEDDDLDKRFLREDYFSYNGIRIGTMLIPRT
jgi:hypothetical protein